MKLVHTVPMCHIYLLFIHISTSTTTHVQNLWQENDYSLKQFCNATNVTSESYLLLPARKSLLQCAIVCSGDASCMAYTHNNDSSCDLFGRELWQDQYNCSSSSVSSGDDNFNSSINAFVKTSTRRWVPVEADKTASTKTYTEGWIGDRLMEETRNSSLEGADCTEGKILGNFTDDTMYLVKPSLAPEPFPVLCLMSGVVGMTQIQLKASDNTSFNRTWQEFRDGFDFSPQEDFWLGNDKLHYLTASNAQTMVMSIFVDGIVHQRFLYDFMMTNETENFAVTYTESFSNASLETYLDSCWGNESIKFSTYDFDNDGMNFTNCATEFGAGWWYNSPNCSACNPNGDLYFNETQRLGILNENFWSAVPLNESSPDQVWMALFRN